MLAPSMEYNRLQNGFRPNRETLLRWKRLENGFRPYVRRPILFLNERATISFSTCVHLKGIAEDYLSHS